jgi:uncharacterized protein YjbJ (UPF0337 family)
VYEKGKQTAGTVKQAMGEISEEARAEINAAPTQSE